jgi:hypothetical protein
VAVAILLELASFSAKSGRLCASTQFGVADETSVTASAIGRCSADVTSFEYRPGITGDASSRVGDVTRQISLALIKAALLYGMFRKLGTGCGVQLS